MDLLLPWEHKVCEDCLKRNPNAIWLVKYGCFGNHRWNNSVHVVIDNENMELVRVRPPPSTIHNFWGQFHMCKGAGHCSRSNCKFAHSALELDKWNAIKSMLACGGKGCQVSARSPSQICSACFNATPQTVWMAWMPCKKHRNKPKITTVISSDGKCLVKIREPSSMAMTNPAQLRSHPDCKHLSCLDPHSPEELAYWKWRVDTERMCSALQHKMLGHVSFRDMCSKYLYPDQQTVLRGVTDPLSWDNYRGKFHKLVYLDNLEHARKMVTDCDGELMVSREYADQVLIKGMENSAMDYVAQNTPPCTVQIRTGVTLLNGTYDRRRDGGLLVRLHQCTSPKDSFKAYVHFEYNHWYFWRLHLAISYAHPGLIDNLVNAKLPRYRPLQWEAVNKRIALKIDNEYQEMALKKMLLCRPGSPFLLMGPFGTGKTHLLVTAITKLLKTSQTNRILICTHQNKGADHICSLLNSQKFIGPALIARLYPDDKTRSLPQQLCFSIRDTNVSQLVSKGVIITTFMTALRLKEKDRGDQLHFSHIIIDEGAQSREPEALGALLMAQPDTHIIIAGDNKQVGPAVSVYCDLARENGLGVSMLERLLDLYQNEYKDMKQLNFHRHSLLTNYRCHPSILLLASSLFYECTLLSRSTSKTHPLAPYPIVFHCSSVQQDRLKVSETSNRKEAELLVDKVAEFIEAWPLTESEHHPHIAILAGTARQAEELRRKLRSRDLPFHVEVTYTYTIQGSEFDAVFLSTHEPIDNEGKPVNVVRSICNEYVFNTVITRSRSLIVAVGNPFLLIKMGTYFPINCWSELIQRCITCQSFYLPQGINTPRAELPKMISTLTERVLPTELFQDLYEQKNEEGADVLLTNYIKLLNKRGEYFSGLKLVQDPRRGEKVWQMEEEPESDHIVLGELKLNTHHKGVVKPHGGPEIKVTSMRERRCFFDGDKVPVDTRTNEIVMNEEFEQKFNEAHFGKPIVCRVNPLNMIEFMPLDKRCPILINLPSLTKFERDGVICFEPSSLNDRVKVSNFIPKDQARKMVFVVKVLQWRQQFSHPLGITVGALPCGTSIYSGDLLLKVTNHIPMQNSCTDFNNPPDCSQPDIRPFKDVITIDPEGSTDHDDALSCVLLSGLDGCHEYEFGVHITDVQKFVPKDSKCDCIARERGCSVYSSSDNCVSHMLPEQIVTAASILHEQTRDSFSVIARVSIKQKKVVGIIRSIKILKSKITSSQELTYEQAQKFIFAKKGCRPFKALWAIACHLREQRLGQRAAAHIQARREDEIAHPEAHTLVKELMIWANQEVAVRLSDFHPMVLRCQQPPSQDELDELVAAHGQHMAMSLDLQQHTPQTQTYQNVQVLHETIREMGVALREGCVRTALHRVQLEHLQPQVAVAHALYRQICTPSIYCITDDTDDTDYSHNSLQCDLYTRFTSPIRRYADLVVQRMLLANLQDKENPYVGKEEEIKGLCGAQREREREMNKYEDGRRNLVLASSLQQSSREYVCFVKKIENGKLFTVFCDPSLKMVGDVYLKHLNAKTISQKESSPEPEEEESAKKSSCTWQVKMASANGKPKSFLKNPYLEHSEIGADIEIVFFTPEHDRSEPDQNSDLEEKRVKASIRPFTQSVPADNWRQLQGYALSPPSNADAVKKLLPKPPELSQGKFPDITHSPLWVYELHRPLQSCEVLRVQWTGCFNSNTQILSPIVQLLEVGPNLRVCIQHNSNPAECFTDISLTKPPKQGHTSIDQYFHYWERVILAEAATASLTDTELLIITNVKLIWPTLNEVIDSQGQVFYQLPTGGRNDEPQDYCVCMKLNKSFATSSYDFFNIVGGDLLCVRCYESVGGDGVRGVLHMVVHSTTHDEEAGPITVYLKFVGDRPNYISKTMKEALSKLTFEVQLIPLSLPFRRIYNSLKNLRWSCSKSLPRMTALGITKCGENAPHISKLLPKNVARVATALWKRNPQASKGQSQNLNSYQRHAIELACSHPFVMIQGPPGTGKSVTGAHIAYALAMKLVKEVGKVRRKDGERTCVMYCGPSQQSVNVVLDILISSKEVQDSDLKIVRVYSNAIERNDFQGPNYNQLIFRPLKDDGKCEEKFKKFSLHVLIRQQNPLILEYDKEFKQLKEGNKIPSSRKRSEYRKMVMEASIAVLQDDVDIVLCTCNEAGSGRINRSINPQYCIIDECAMATEPECMVAIKRAESVVLIGDDKQLQPVLLNKDAKRMGMGTSLFERYCKAGAQPHMLKTQYRMHEVLCKFPSREFYNSELQTDPSVAVKYSPILGRLANFWPSGKNTPMMLCNVVGTEGENHTGHRGSAKVGLESKRNSEEAKTIAETAQKLISEFGVKAQEIAAITPYSAQKEEIKKYLERENVKGVTVKTITDSQGSEFGIVLLSTVRSQELCNLRTASGERRKTDFGWRREKLGFITDRHQICVGITRCQYGLVIVGNKELLSHDPTWEKLINHFEIEGCVVEEREMEL